MKTHTLVKAATAALLFAAIPLGSVNAVVTQPAPAAATATATANAQKLANLKTKGAAEIDRRTANLGAALTKLQASAKLTASDKSALTAQVQAELTALAALKTKLTADADLATARLDVQAIVNDYRVYVLMLPKTRLVAADDRFSVVEAKLTALQTKLQTRITARKTAGKDVTALQTSLADMTAKTADATTKTSGLVDQLLAIQPTDYNANHAVLMNYRAALGAAQTDVKTARNDAKSITDGLQAK